MCLETAIHMQVLLAADTPQDVYIWLLAVIEGILLPGHAAYTNPCSLELI